MVDQVLFILLQFLPVIFFCQFVLLLSIGIVIAHLAVVAVYGIVVVIDRIVIVINNIVVAVGIQTLGIRGVGGNRSLQIRIFQSALGVFLVGVSGILVRIQGSFIAVQNILVIIQRILVFLRNGTVGFDQFAGIGGGAGQVGICRGIFHGRGVPFAQLRGICGSCQSDAHGQGYNGGTADLGQILCIVLLILFHNFNLL